MAHDVRGAADGHRRFFCRHPAKVVHLDDLGQRGLLALERLERAVEIQQLEFLRSTLVADFDVRVPGNRRLSPAALGRGVRTCVVDQHLPHHPRHQRQKMRAIGEVRIGIVKQLDEGFVDERCRLQGVTGPLAAHERPRNPLQLALHQRHQLVEGGVVALAHPVQQTRDFSQSVAPRVVPTPLQLL